jgi:Ca2+/H+ antiporter
MANSNLQPTNMITTSLIEHIVAVVGDAAEGTINVDHEAIIEVEIHFEMIARRSATFVRSQITSQLGTL